MEVVKKNECKFNFNNKHSKHQELKVALVKQIELELHGELGLRRGFYIGLFDSNGDAYNFSEGINFPAANSEYKDGMKINCTL